MATFSHDEKVTHPRTSEVSDSLGDDLVRAKNGSEFDKRDMHRMGKLQQLRRNFRFVTIFGFTMVLMATWEAQLVPTPILI